MASLFALVTIGFYSCDSSSTTPEEKEPKVVTAYAKPEPEMLSIAHMKDDVSGEEYRGMSRSLIAKEGKDGFGIQIVIKKKGDSYYADNIMMNVKGVGSCQEDNTVYFLFDDGTKEKLKMWNDFNCDGDAYFRLNESILAKLSKPIKTIRIENGRTFDTYDSNLTGQDKNYFIEVSEAIKNNKVIEVKEIPSY